MERRYTINEKRIVFEIFDKEVVLVNLDTGHYFVLEQSAGDIWRCLACGLTVPEAARHLEAVYAVQREGLENDIAELLGKLVEDQLLELHDSESRMIDGLSLPEPGKMPRPYAEPFVFRYTEMENLIQMDPIREVDESGWPKQRVFPKKKGQ